MAQITWNNVAAPNLGESNSLFAQAIQSLKDAGAGLKDTAKDYQTVVRNRSHAILQDYINSAKTPEELQSEAFNIGFKNLQATLANEYDAVKVNEYRDSAVDKLTKRAGDAVALDLNRLNLTSNTRKENTALGMAELQGLVDNPTAYAAKKAELTQKGIFDGKAEQDFQLGVYNIKNAKRTDDFGNATYDANVENALKAPFVRPITSILPFKSRFLEFAAEHRVPIRDWSESRSVISDLEELRSTDLIIDEVGTYFDARTFKDLPLSTRLWLAQASKLGVDIYGAAQDFSQVDISFRRLTNELYEISKIIGSPRPDISRPPVEHVWGLCMLRELNPIGYDEKNKYAGQKSIPKFFLIQQKYCEVYDTNKRVPKAEFPPFRHVLRRCELAGCKLGTHDIIQGQHYKILHT